MIAKEIKGNEYVINLSQSQYDDCGGYWIQLAEQRARATKREVVIVVNDKIYYRSTEHQHPTGERGLRG